MDKNWNAVQGNKTDAEYSAFLGRVSGRYMMAATQYPVFKTDAPNLWGVYLAAFSPEDRQTHNCNSCHHFIHRYADLVVINPATGEQVSALWVVEDAPPEYRDAVAAMKAQAERAKVVSPFYSGLTLLGRPKTGQWTHLYASNPKVYVNPVRAAHEEMAAKQQSFQLLRKALDEYSVQHVEQALAGLQAGVFNRSDSFVPVVEFFLKLKKATASMTGKLEKNLIWHAVATNSEGFVRIGTSVVGTLLDDVKAGVSLDVAKKKFNEKTNTTVYQRAQVAPRAGQIDAAEKAFQTLGLASALSRRYAQAADLFPGVQWLPTQFTPSPTAKAPKAGTFDHLRKQETVEGEIDIPAKKMTWEKFADTVLPGAAHIEYRVPQVGRFCALTAAADEAAPPILRWDSAEHRNTVSWSFPNPAATAQQWNLQPGTLVSVSAIVSSPSQWGSKPEVGSKGAFLLLEGAKDTRGVAGGGLFPEHLSADVRPYRATIEAHMNSMVVQGTDDPGTQAFGIGLLAGAEFTERAAPKAVKATVRSAGVAPSRVHVILVIDDSGSMQNYLYAARQAVEQLIAAQRELPGEVYVTAIKFGANATALCRGMRLDTQFSVHAITSRMTASSGGTALNDTLGDAISTALLQHGANAPDTAFFLGIVTDGEENQSRRYSHAQVRHTVQQVLATGRWTIAYAGAGRDPANYAASVGIPAGNVKVFEASARGFADVGASYAASTATLAQGYRSGQRATTSFFAAGTQATLGTDHPVLVVTNKSGSKAAYEIDRWE